MKDAFENSFKKSLDNYELPYDSSAWDAMRAKLDANASGASSNDNFEQSFKDKLNANEFDYNPNAWTAMQAKLDAGASGGNNFEQDFKDKLNANEYPYNPAAWSALNDRLDGKNKGGKGKWFVAASVLAVVSVATYMLPTSDSNTSSEKNNTDSNQTTTTTVSPNTTNNGVNNNITANNSTNSNSNSVVSNVENNQNDPNVADFNPFAVLNEDSGRGSNGNNNKGDDGTVNGNGNENDRRLDPKTENQLNGSNPDSTPKVWNYVDTEVTTACLGSTINVDNHNNYPLIIVSPNGSQWSAKAKEKARFTPSISGTYLVGYNRDNEFVEQETFAVKPLPKADFEFVDLSQKYLNGVPTIEVHATTNAQSYTWKYENGTEYGMDADVHLYNKGVYPIKLTVVGAAGCRASVTKSLTIDENYNLMANTGFYPTGNDIETNTFMPFALTKRNISFTMIIIDPKDGHLIYETNDASAGWDGIDRQTGALVPLERNYIWKVTIHNPEKGESSEYAGTILPLPSR